jgi:hypothetical protein
MPDGPAAELGNVTTPSTGYSEWAQISHDCDWYDHYACTGCDCDCHPPATPPTIKNSQEG